MNYAEAIEQLYAAFADVPRPVQLEHCPCGCANHLDFEALLNKPLRELPGEVLSPYSAKAISTVGSSQDFLFYFPRILELALDRLNYPLLTDTEIIFSKLDYGGIVLSTMQREAVDKVLYNHWLSQIPSYDPEDNCFLYEEELLACVIISHLSLQPFLDAWVAIQTRGAIGQLANFICEHYPNLLVGKVWNGFLEDEHNSYSKAKDRKEYAVAAMRDWLEQPVILERLQWLEAQIADDNEWPHTLENTRKAIQLLSKD